MSRNRSTTVKKYSKLLKKDRDFDWAFMLYLEQLKLKRVAKYFTKSQLVFGWERMVLEINLCIKLIDIILEKDSRAYSGEGNLLFYVNTKNHKRFMNKFKEDNNFYKDELRQTKALHLYNLIRTYKMRSWWD